ncbi:unnamed protein product [Leuciscus chuanchicus]
MKAEWRMIEERMGSSGWEKEGRGGEQAAEVGGSLLVGSAPVEGVIPAAVLPVISVVQPSLSVSIRVSSVRARRRIRGSDGSRAKGQNGPFKRTQPVQGARLEMQVWS